MHVVRASSPLTRMVQMMDRKTLSLFLLQDAEEKKYIMVLHKETPAICHALTGTTAYKVPLEYSSLK